MTTTPVLRTERLTIRDWSTDDAEAALGIYGAQEVARWLTPEMRVVTDVEAMRSVLAAWVEAQPNLVPPAGRWAVVRESDGALIGGLSLRLLPPFEEDFELNWQLDPRAWGHGYATEAGRALVGWAFEQGVEELFAVARPKNARAIATARRLGMEWVGETEKYYNTRLQVFRIRPSQRGA
ncbi:GNAT family N-acetyltransferase [Streptomonospora nanhaiensis]|uniref:RimJ/RimL family protein N-acetyltransferase n=1 Tax=Streptomonospora nanhaiensis TaxID=1323731 RepID=A0A853BHV3_9ACTN|nr:GNAT family N-acetyltransferase [Streptomonospora nanhaiensis]MBV2366447.1 GNAT family N-acetyltransferase [Streptomonospora nanhaiensis]MBX9389272.1 GNAT family N-acetyltransferase [Streptomonospora nanhaiensis]NYI94182.1 RimJ/RimL family protein N-acetyltransferase [Streptomonospora nanhaiensis]